MKKIMLGIAGLAFATMLFFRPPVQSQGNGYYKLKNCLAIGTKKCTNSGSDCAHASGCAAPPLD